MKATSLEPVFARYLPRDLDEGRLYISMEYATASHLCACGCGNRVVTPLGIADWHLLFDGHVTLTPSIGNGQFDCGSHYLIRNDRVVWLRSMRGEVAAKVLTADAQERRGSYGRIHGSRNGQRWIRRYMKLLGRRRG